MSIFITSTGSELVSLSEAKEWCHVYNDDHDTILTSLIASAREQVENDTSRVLVDKTLVQRLDSFPCKNTIELYQVPLREVTSITYIDGDGDLQTLDDEIYTVDIYSAPARIVLNYEEIWPITDVVPNAVTITFKAGYTGASNYTLPSKLKDAILFLVAHWFENRSPNLVGLSIADIPITYERSIFPFKVFV